MSARQLIDGAAFGPDALQALGQAFDAAWQAIADNFGDDPQDIEKARFRLANGSCQSPTKTAVTLKCSSVPRCNEWRWTIVGAMPLLSSSEDVNDTA
jgi:hypothetical protein